VPSAAAHCPHCLLRIADGSEWPYPRGPERCPHCRLMIGPGRARLEAGDDGDSRSRGSAAGVLANAARREHGEPGDPATVLAGLRAVAGLRASPVERLRMLDYQQAAEVDPSLPSLATVLATFGTWKGARHEAGLQAALGKPRVQRAGADAAETRVA
jgi:hypothetical protein